MSNSGRKHENMNFGILDHADFKSNGSHISNTWVLIKTKPHPFYQHLNVHIYLLNCSSYRHYEVLKIFRMAVFRGITVQYRALTELRCENMI